MYNESHGQHNHTFIIEVVDKNQHTKNIIHVLPRVVDSALANLIFSPKMQEEQVFPIFG